MVPLAVPGVGDGAVVPELQRRWTGARRWLLWAYVIVPGVVVVLTALSALSVVGRGAAGVLLMVAAAVAVAVPGVGGAWWLRVRGYRSWDRWGVIVFIVFAQLILGTVLSGLVTRGDSVEWPTDYAIVYGYPAVFFAILAVALARHRMVHPLHPEHGELDRDIELIGQTRTSGLRGFGSSTRSVGVWLVGGRLEWRDASSASSRDGLLAGVIDLHRIGHITPIPLPPEASRRPWFVSGDGQPWYKSATQAVLLRGGPADGDVVFPVEDAFTVVELIHRRMRHVPPR